jgi:HD-GYP domain-containing protein (c-di-GMP phosphodiesterase class II)/ribonuclease BN (tRNA processing enzyme)
MNYLKVLGASGSKTKLTGTTSFQIFKDILVDAGNVINTLGEEVAFINHIFLTHSHSDHIIDLPFIIESFYESRKETLIIYGSKETITSLKKHTFNDEVWPDFTRINLLNSDKKALELKIIEENETLKLAHYEITPILANHIKGAFGFVIIKDNTNGYVISGDTYKNDKLWEIINNNKKIRSLIIECSFPSKMKKLAFDSKHLTPELLNEELKNLKRDDIQIFIYHLKPLYYKQMVDEINSFNILSNGGKVLEEGDVIHIDTGEIETNMISQNKFERIMDINLELSSELDKDKLFEMILTLTRELTHCEAGTLYIMSKDKKSLEFKVIQNDPMNIHMGGTKDNLTWNPLQLYLKNGYKNENMVAVVSALENKIINIADVYCSKKYDFEGTKRFDKTTGYKSKSMLVIPLVNHEKDVIGVLQLINKTKVKNKIIAFEESDETIIKALAGQAAMALTNTQLISSLEEFLNAFVSTIGHAIDAKSKHTMNHISNVATISNLIAKAIHKDNTIYKEIKYNKNDLKEIELSALMHDIGKISMPESIIDKSTKLEKIVDRIEIIKDRFEIIKRDLEILYLKKSIDAQFLKDSLEQIEEDIRFIETVNIGSEFMAETEIDRIKLISEYTYYLNGQKVPLLSADEVENLSIRKGTLSDNEKDSMNNHAQLSLNMLSTLPFPKKYSKVLNIAVNHHEKLNGKGYPRGLKEKDLTLEDRIMILSDIFEALTASDRPYKDAKKLSEVFKILSIMAKEKEIDPVLLEFFYNNDELMNQIKKNLKPSQLDRSKLDI